MSRWGIATELKFIKLATSIVKLMVLTDYTDTISFRGLISSFIQQSVTLLGSMASSSKKNELCLDRIR